MHPILIADCCQNHNGRRETLGRMVHAAAESGADFVKIQAIRSKELTFRERFEHGETAPDGSVLALKRPFEPELARLSKLDLSTKDEQWFVEECRRAGVGSMVTVFTRTAAREVREMGFEAVKIASYDCPSYPLLRDVRGWWSRIFVSTGGCHAAEITRAARLLAGSEYSLLHCVTIYPTPLDQLNLLGINWLRRFTPSVGFSDHTLVARDGLLASRVALALGATCVERHFTILPPDETRDGPVSATPDMFAQLREFSGLARRDMARALAAEAPAWERTLGQPNPSRAAAELLNRDYYAGRFASKLGNRVIYNHEDVEIDLLLDQGESRAGM